MIITRLKPKNQIIELIKNHKNIFLVGCGSCAEQCRTGGKEDVKIMKELLEKQDKVITGTIVPDETCHIPLVKKELRKYTLELKNSDCILVMACGAGVSAVREATIKRIYPACDTISLGNTIRKDIFIGRCSLCGECVLDQTNGFCPITMCPKGILNGPCGGMDKGKCEVNKEMDCVWNSIYNTLLMHNEIENMRVIKKPKDYSKIQRNVRIEVG